MDDALEAIAFLSRSANRVSVLVELAEEPRERDELGDVIDASRTTLSRVLNDLEGRGWIGRRGTRYQATPVGRHVVESFMPLVETMTGVERLGDVGGLLPAEVSLDLRHFRGATVVRPDTDDPTAHLDHGVARLGQGARIRIISNTIVPEYARVVRERVAVDDVDFDSVVASTFLDELEPGRETTKDVRAIVREGGTIRRHPGSVPYNLFLVDGTTLFWLCNEDGSRQALLESADETVRSWVEATFRAFSDRANPFEPQPARD